MALAASPARAADPFDEHTDRAIALYQEQRFEEAIAEFQAAYALRQWPRLLFNIGQAHMRLGHAREALGYYEQYLRVQPDPPPEAKEELERAMAQARALLEPPRPPKPAPPPPQLLPPPPRPAPPPPRPSIARAWWLWTGVGLLAGAAVTAGVLGAQPWQSAAWRAVPESNRRGVTF